MSFQLSGELGEMGESLAKFGKKVASDALRSSKEGMLKNMEGLVPLTDEQ